MIVVANKKHQHWIGLYIGRPSVLGNPFSHLEGTLAEFKVASRDEAVDKYLVWLREQYALGGEVYDTLEALVDEYMRDEPITLICWCAPERCHGDVIKAAIEKLAVKRRRAHNP